MRVPSNIPAPLGGAGGRGAPLTWWPALWVPGEAASPGGCPILRTRLSSSESAWLACVQPIT